MVDPASPSSSAPGTGRRVGQSAGLGPERIRAKAMEIIEAEGPEALTMRRLARELDVTPMSLYHHVGSKQELTAQLQRTVMDNLILEGDRGAWPTRLRAAFAAIFQTAIDYPQLAQVAITNPTSFYTNEPVFDEVRQAISEAGVPPARADHVLVGVTATLGGCVLMMTTGLGERLRPAATGGYPVQQAAEICIAYITSEATAARKGATDD